MSSKGLEGDVSRDGSSLGSYDFADDVEILDVDDEGGYARIYPDRLAGAELESDDVSYYSLNELGEIDRLIRNQQVACSSHVSSSTNRRKSDDFRRFCHFLRKYGVGQNVGQTLTHTVTHMPKQPERAGEDIHSLRPFLFLCVTALAP